jgi:peptide/nickel transport system permease protein
LLALIARRLAFAIPVLILVSFLVFSLQELLPGDAAVTIVGESATEAQLQQVRESMNLDEPFFQRYADWLGGVAQGDFGETVRYSNRGETVASQISDRLPITLTLAIGALVVAVLIALPLGVLGGMRPGGWADRFGRLISTLGIAIPSFWLAMILVLTFSVNNEWLPVAGFVPFGESPWDWFQHLILPWISLGLWLAAGTIRQLRQALIDVLGSAYVRTAWAKGAGPTRVVGKHALKNAAIPATTVLAVGFANVLGGTVIIEQIFSMRGMGSYFLEAVVYRDIPVLLGVTMVFVIGFMVVVLLLDIVYGLLNPRVRVS